MKGGGGYAPAYDESAPPLVMAEAVRQSTLDREAMGAQPAYNPAAAAGGGGGASATFAYNPASGTAVHHVGVAQPAAAQALYAVAPPTGLTAAVPSRAPATAYTGGGLWNTGGVEQGGAAGHSAIAPAPQQVVYQQQQQQVVYQQQVQVQVPPQGIGLQQSMLAPATVAMQPGYTGQDHCCYSWTVIVISSLVILFFGGAGWGLLAAGSLVCGISSACAGCDAQRYTRSGAPQMVGASAYNSQQKAKNCADYGFCWLVALLILFVGALMLFAGAVATAVHNDGMR